MFLFFPRGSFNASQVNACGGGGGVFRDYYERFGIGPAGHSCTRSRRLYRARGLVEGCKDSMVSFLVVGCRAQVQFLNAADGY